MVRVVIFDFDGVIVESNAIKDQAFRDLYLPFGEDAGDRALALHLGNHGKSRFEKFKMMHDEILNRSITDEEMERMGEEFSEMCFRRICECPYVPGALEFLEKFSKQIPLAVASATPEVELQKIVSARGIQHHFKHIFGKPTEKSANLLRILRAESVDSREALFVGDQISDWEAAQKASVPFFGRYAELGTSPFLGLPLKAAGPDLRELSAHLDGF